MGNKYKGTFDIEIGSETFTLRPSFDAMIEFEDQCGLCVNVAFDDLQNGRVSFKVVAAAIWAGIKGEHLATGTKQESFRVIGEKIKMDGLANSAKHAMTFLMYSLISDEDMNTHEEAVAIEKSKASKKKKAGK